MTDPTKTAIAVLMDRSGSMDDLVNDATGGLAAFIREQAALPGKCTIRLSEFDDEYNEVYASVSIGEAPPYQMVAGGSTALLDAMGRLMEDFGAELAAMSEHERPGKVLVVFETDGGENASRKWSKDAVFDLIKQQKEVYGWDFVFMAANQDAIATASTLGIGKGSSLTYASSPAGTRSSFSSLSHYTTVTRSGSAPAAFSDEDREAAGTE